MSKTTTKPSTLQIDLQFQPLHTPEAILNAIYIPASDAIEQYGLINSYCNIHIKLGKRSKLFVQVEIDALTSDVKYFAAHNPKVGQFLPALSYTQALNTIRQLMA